MDEEPGRRFNAENVKGMMTIANMMRRNQKKVMVVGGIGILVIGIFAGTIGMYMYEENKYKDLQKRYNYLLHRGNKQAAASE